MFDLFVETYFLKNRPMPHRRVVKEDWRQTYCTVLLVHIVASRVKSSRKSEDRDILHLWEPSQTVLYVRIQTDTMNLQEPFLMKVRTKTAMMYLQEPVIMAVRRQTDRDNEPSRTISHESQKTDRHNLPPRTSHNDSQKTDIHTVLNLREHVIMSVRRQTNILNCSFKSKA